MEMRCLAVVVLAAMLGACAGNPMTADEFRRAVKGGAMMTTTESFTINRPLSDVATSFKKKAPECLSMAFSSQRKPVIGMAGSPHVYATTKPTVLASAQRVELYLQVRTKGNLASEPPDGVYFFVADASPLDRGRTRLDFYRASRAAALAEAVKGWASGQGQGCPDLSTYF